MEAVTEMEIKMEIEIQMQIQMQMEMEMEMQMEMVIFKAPKASCELRFASKRLLASDFEALEVSGTPRGDQESLKEVSKSSKVTIHRACRVIMSSPEALQDIGPASTELRPVRDPPSTLVIFAVDVVP